MRISPEPWELLDRQAREPRTRPTTLLRMWLNGRLLAVTPVGAASAGSGLALLSPDEILRALDNAGLPDGTDRFMRELLVAIIRLIAAGESWEPARDTPGDAHPVG